jgi:tetratricopeptide (TPR) repeat protein
LPPKTSAAKSTRPAIEAKAPAPEPAEEPSPNRAEAFAHFATGISYELNEKPALALEEFFQAAVADPANEQLVIELARRFLGSKQTDRALQVLTKAAERKKASGTIHAWLARAYLQGGRTNDALATSQVAIKKSPESLTGYQNVAEILYLSGKGREVGQVLDLAARQKTVDAGFLAGLADLYAKFSRAEPGQSDAVRPRAVEVLNRAVALKTGNPTTLQKIADNFVFFGERKQAAELYLQLLEDPDLYVLRDLLHEKLVNIYLQGQDRVHAIEQLEAIVKDSPTRYPQAYYHLGSLAYQQDQYDKAEDYFNKALLLNPNFEQAYYDLAGMQINIHKPGDALRTLEKARGVFRQTFVSEFFSALAYSGLKNFTEALTHFTSAEVIARATEPKRLNHQFYFQLAATYERNHDYVEAEKYFEKCLELSPDYAEALNYLGYMWAERGVNLDKARGMIEKAVKLEPKNAAFLDSLGWVLFRLNQPKDALSYLLKAVELSKEPDPTLFDHVGDIYFALHEPAKAQEAWKKSLAIEPNDTIRKKLASAGQSKL